MGVRFLVLYVMVVLTDVGFYFGTLVHHACKNILGFYCFYCGVS